MAPQDSADEQAPLLPRGDVEADQTSLTSLQPRAPNPYLHLPVYTTIHRIRHEVIDSLEDPYSLDQLRAPRINASIVRPLANRLFDLNDVSVPYCLLVNKLQFLREQTFVAHQTINTTRALLCELLAQKIMRRFDEENASHDGLLLLANMMVGGFEPFQNAPPEIVRENYHALKWTVQDRGGYERKSTFLELAIISESKMLLSSPACQKVMDAIYVGRIVYTPSSFMDILPDYYKHKPITLYHPETAPLLNQYRLMVPRTRNYIDIIQFLILMIFYILAMNARSGVEFTTYECIFCIYGLGWVLDELASVLEHGWQCYTQNLWSFLDSIFAAVFVIYFVMRIHSISGDDSTLGRPALDILAAGAPVLIPRIAFNLMSENMLFVCLRAMMADFTVLTLLAVWCFGGFLLSMFWLGEGAFQTVTIAKWMLYVWFGLDGTGIQRSVDFHWLIGPILMVTFAFLGNTLFLTILVSMLSSTYSKIASNANAEIQFRRAVLTFEGVKSDAIFAYQPPFNVLALCFVLPLKLALTPRWFHKINVAIVRTINAPLLLSISLFERRHLWTGAYNPPTTSSPKPKKREASPWSLLKFWDLRKFNVHGDIQAVFEYDPPQEVLNGIHKAEDEEENEEGHALTRTLTGGGKQKRPPLPSRQMTKSHRKESFGHVAGFSEHLSDFLHEHGGADLAQRLEALETSNQRIEEMLYSISQDLGNDDSSENTVPPSRTRTHDDSVEG